MSKEALINRLHASLVPEFTAFLAEPSAEEAEHQRKIDEAKAMADASTIPEVARAIRSAVKEMEANRPDSTPARRQDAAVALLTVTNSLRLPLQLKVAPAAKSEGATAPKAKRASRAEMGELVAAVLEAFPKDGKVRISELAGKVKAEVPAVRSALLKLKREGKVAPNGSRGRDSAWKLA